jgi:hypothetical protein
MANPAFATNINEQFQPAAMRVEKSGVVRHSKFGEQSLRQSRKSEPLQADPFGKAAYVKIEMVLPQRWLE